MDVMSFVLPPLPYALDALAPHISKETLEYHYHKHNLAYVNKLNELLKDSDDINLSVEEVMLKHPSGPIYNNAAQIWNHRIYWQCMSAQHNQQPQGSLAEAIDRDFGSTEAFMRTFAQKGMSQFGSGWTWLLSDKQGKLSIQSTPNADNLVHTELTTLIACDVWEHAYYIDTRNDRASYLDNFWKVTNFAFALDQYEAITQ